MKMKEYALELTKSQLKVIRNYAKIKKVKVEDVTFKLNPMKE